VKGYFSFCFPNLDKFLIFNFQNITYVKDLIMEGFDKVLRELLLDDFRREIVFLLARLGLSKNIF
jgi:hypothetical protein